MKARYIVFAWGMILVWASGAYAEEVKWLGAYKGPTIPGYKIEATELIAGEYNGAQRQSVYEELAEYMVTLCTRRHGIAIVNVTFTSAVGDVRSPTKSGQIKVFTPGLHIGGSADCVLKAERVMP